MLAYGNVWIFFKLLPIATGWDVDYLPNMLIPLCQLARMQEFVYFISQKLTDEDSIKVEKFMLTIQQQLPITQMVFTNRSDIRLTDSDIKKMYIGMVFTTSVDDPILYVHDRVLLGKRFSVSMLVVVNLLDDFNVVKRYVHDMHRRNFQMSLLYVQNSNGTNGLWGYNVFPRFSVDNRTDIWGWLFNNIKKIQAASLDTEGYTFQTPLRVDVPYVFPYKHAMGEITLHGTSYKMIEHFIKFLNASLLNYVMPDDRFGGDVIDMKAALSLVRNGEVEFLAHAYALFAIDDEIDKSYPLMVVKWCLMVPIWNSVSTFYYPVQPFDVIVWLTFSFTFIALVFTDVLLLLRQQSDVKRLRSKLLQHVRESILHDFCFVLNISTGKTLRTPTSLLRAFVFVTVFFYGFFLSANYSAVLGSILTVNLFREDINNVEDLIRANITVMIIDYELEFLLAGGNELSSDFYKLLLPVDAATFARHQLTLNASFAYFITEDKWHFLHLQQKHLKQGIFKFTDICFGSHHLAYPMQKDSPIWRNLEYYIFRMHSSGMLQYYESTSFDYAVHAGLMTRLTEANEYTSAGLEHLFMVFMLVLLVFILSFFIFIGECLLHRILRGVMKRRNTKRRLRIGILT